MNEDDNEPSSKQRRPNLAEQVSRDIASRIAAGTIGLGERLPSELEMSRTLGVSRAVIREAISRLKQDGLVEARQGSGAFVKRLTPPATFQLSREDIEGSTAQLSQVFELRLTIEGDAAGYAAFRRSDADVAVMADSLAAIEGDIRAGQDGIDPDFAFHCAVARASGNPFVLQLIELLGEQLKESIRVARMNSSSYRGRPQAVLAEHTEIFDAIAERRVHAAGVAARRHVMNAARRLGLVIGL